MRIGIDYRSALVNGEGIGRYTRELVRGLVELGLDGDLGLFGYTLKGKRYSMLELGLADSRAELLRLRLPSKWLPGLLRRTGKGVDDLVGGCDVYHHTQPNLLEVRQATEVVTIFDCIYALDAHNPEGPGFLDGEAAARMTANAKAMVQRARRVLVPCQFVGAEVVLSLGAHPGRVSVTPLGCDHVVRHLPPGGFPPAEEPYVLTVSRVDRRKNHVRMLQAFEMLVRDGHPHRWVVAGPAGFGCEDFERALSRSPAAERVVWRRSVSDAEIVELYARADVLMWASLSEGFGLPPLEAMACGTPVVTSIVTSMPEVCADAAFLVEPTDPERIFEATRRLIVERDLRDDHISRGLRRAREHTWRSCARDTLLAYQAAWKDTGSEPLKLTGLF
jgi:glycosyltransferase involved in cell wall biosynthesis